jgi:hypothetical protein
MTGRIRLDDLTSDQLDALYDERDEARQHAAAIAAQRDRLRQRMNNLADRWETALPGQPHHGFATALRAEISVAPFHGEHTAVQQYRADDGSQKWAARCWGTDTCDGWLSLDHDTERWAEIARDRHVAEAHTEPTAAAAGILLTRTTDERDQLKAALIAVLGLFPHDLNPNGPAVRSRHVPAELVERWRMILAAATSGAGAEAGGHDGPVVDRQTAVVLAALHHSAEATVTRVIDLYERWVKAGPPPLGTSTARWWDKRLAELHGAIQPKEQ